MGIQDIQPLYKWIVDSVIAKSRAAFLQEGVDEALLDELRTRWEQKLMDSDVFLAENGDALDEAAAAAPASDGAGTSGGDGAAPSAAAATPADDDDGNLDELDDNSEEEEDGDGIQNLVLAQYDKVARTKNRWKCHMKNGIVHIRGREYVFAKCTGEFTF